MPPVSGREVTGSHTWPCPQELLVRPPYTRHQSTHTHAIPNQESRAESSLEPALLFPSSRGLQGLVLPFGALMPRPPTSGLLSTLRPAAAAAAAAVLRLCCRSYGIGISRAGAISCSVSIRDCSLLLRVVSPDACQRA